MDQKIPINTNKSEKSQNSIQKFQICNQNTNLKKNAFIEKQDQLNQYKSLFAQEIDQQQQEHLQKKEQFSINLRKFKKQNILQIKRARRDFMILSKKKCSNSKSKQTQNVNDCFDKLDEKILAELINQIEKSQNYQNGPILSLKPEDEIEIFTQLKRLTQIEFKTSDQLQITEVLSKNSFLLKRMVEILKNGYEGENTLQQESMKKSHRLIRNICKIFQNLVISYDDICIKLLTEYDILPVLNQMFYKHFLKCQNDNICINQKILLIKDTLWLMNNLLVHQSLIDKEKTFSQQQFQLQIEQTYMRLVQYFTDFEQQEIVALDEEMIFLITWGLQAMSASKINQTTFFQENFPIDCQIQEEDFFFPYMSFIQNIFPQIIQLQQKYVDQMNVESKYLKTIRKDFIHIISQCCLNMCEKDVKNILCSDEMMEFVLSYFENSKSCQKECQFIIEYLNYFDQNLFKFQFIQRLIQMLEIDSKKIIVIQILQNLSSGSQFCIRISQNIKEFLIQILQHLESSLNPGFQQNCLQIFIQMFENTFYQQEISQFIKMELYDVLYDLMINLSFKENQFLLQTTLELFKTIFKVYGEQEIQFFQQTYGSECFEMHLNRQHEQISLMIEQLIEQCLIFKVDTLYEEEQDLDFNMRDNKIL